jgi:hypothetical protein
MSYKPGISPFKNAIASSNYSNMETTSLNVYKALNRVARTVEPTSLKAYTAALGGAAQIMELPS